MAIFQHDRLTRSQQAFLLLLRCGLWEQTPQDSELLPAGTDGSRHATDGALLPLTDREWQAVYDESRRQAVQGLVYRGFLQLPERLFPPQAQLLRWLADVDAVEQTYRQSVEATARSWQLLCRSGLQPLLQKGLAVGLLYAHPEERVYGDVDWYVADMAAATALLRREGIATTHAADSSVTFTMGDTDIELHPELLDLLSHSQQAGLLTHGETGAAAPPVHDAVAAMPLTLPDGTVVRTPSALLTLLMLQTHILKHVVTVGIGLRQLCDLARAYHVLLQHTDSTTLDGCYRRLGLRRWTALIHTFLYTYLGLPAAELPTAPQVPGRDCRRLLRAVLRWGNFGQSTPSWQQASRRHLTKLHTATQIAGNLSFALRYAPGMTVRHIGLLIRHQ